MGQLLRQNSALLVVAAFCAAGYFLAPFDPYAQEFLSAKEEGMGWPHLLSVDELGQDVASRLWIGAANTLAYSFLGSLGALLFASLLLVMERSSGRSMAQALRAGVSIGIALPALFLALLLMLFLERSPVVVSLTISIATTPFAFRQLRVLWIEQNKTVYVDASRAIGGGAWHRFAFSIWPNFRPQLIELWKLCMAIAMLEMSALTFLGLGGDPNWAELGSLLRFHQKHLLHQPLLVVWPGMALCVLLWLVRRSRSE